MVGLSSKTRLVGEVSVVLLQDARVVRVRVGERDGAVRLCTRACGWVNEWNLKGG